MAWIHAGGTCSGWVAMIDAQAEMTVLQQAIQTVHFLTYIKNSSLCQKTYENEGWSHYVHEK